MVNVLDVIMEIKGISLTRGFEKLLVKKTADSSIRTIWQYICRDCTTTTVVDAILSKLYKISQPVRNPLVLPDRGDKNSDVPPMLFECGEYCTT